MKYLKSTKYFKNWWKSKEMGASWYQYLNKSENIYFDPIVDKFLYTRHIFLNALRTLSNQSSAVDPKGPNFISS